MSKMLQLILGRSGSGKTFTVTEQIRALLQENPETAPVLLVPEQFSFETERMLIRRLGAKDASLVKVYSFTRLAEMFLRESDRVLSPSLDEGSRLLLLNQAVKETVGLRRLPIREGNSGQLAQLLDALKEWKQNGVSHEQIEDLCGTMPAGELQDKIRDLDVLQQALDALISRQFSDPQDLLSRAYDLLRESDIGRGMALFIDGFMGFTVQEERLLSCLISRAATVTVALCTDTLSGEDEPGLFMLPTETANRLIRLAKDSETPVAPPQYLTEDYRREDEALRLLEQTVFRPDDDAFDGEAEAVTVLSCADKGEECKAVARELRRFLRHGGRCREAAVVMRRVEDYRGVLEMALQSEGIPYYIDLRESIRSDALPETVCAALQVVCGGWQTEDILRLLKTGLLGFSARSVALLENYAYQWGIRGRAWREGFTENPDGLSAAMNETAQKKLEYLNFLRMRVARPLLHLQEALGGEVDGKTFAEAVFTYLKEVRAARLTRWRVRRLDNEGQRVLADRTERVWEATMHLLDVFSHSEDFQKAAVWAQLFSDTASATDLGSLPQGLDAVQVGGADRVRLSEPRLVFLVGANEGVFPGVPAMGGYLSGQERETLAAYGFSLSKNIERELTEERLYAYNALAAARETIYVTYSRGDLSGGKNEPSLLVSEVTRRLPRCRQVDFCTDENWMPETAEEALSYFTASYREPTELSASIREVLCENTASAARIASLERAAEKKPWKLEDKSVARRLFREKMYLSATQVKEYYTCPFAYFCHYGLNVEPRRKAELDALTFGSVTHALLETLIARYAQQGFDNVEPEQIQRDVSQELELYVERNMGGAAQKSAQFMYLLSRLKRTAVEAIGQLVRELAQSRFEPVEYELSIGNEEGQLPPLTLQLDDGVTVEMTGKIDRVDVFQDGETAYVRVVDYKTGSKTFSVKNAADGLNLQMLIYLFTLWENGGDRFENMVPAGVLYMPALLPVVNAQADEATRKEEQSKLLKMDGLVLSEHRVLEAMEEGIAGKYIPVEMKAGDEFAAKSKVATLRQMQVLKEHTEQLLRRMGEELHAGNIDATPLSCDYCKYKEICRFDREHGRYRPSLLGESQTIKALKELEQRADEAKAAEDEAKSDEA